MVRWKDRQLDKKIDGYIERQMVRQKDRWLDRKIE